MVQFGVIKGFLRRVYAFPIWLDHPNLKSKEKEKEKEKVTTRGLKLEMTAGGGESRESRPDFSRAYSSQGPTRTATTKDSLSMDPTYSLPPTRHNSAPDANLSTLNPLPSRASSNESKDSPNNAAPIYPTSLTMMLDGTHHTDEICLKYGIGWRTLEIVLKHLGGGETGAGEGEGEGYAGGEGGGTRRSSTSNGAGGGGGGEKSLYGSRIVMIWI